MPPPIIQLSDIRLTFGGTPLLQGAALAVSAGERICLVGRNGSGKSTLLKIAAGLLEADGGERFVHPGATVRYLPQEPDFAGYDSTLSYVEDGLAPGDNPYPARHLLEQLGLTGEESPAQLSGGEARRLALARVLAPSPDVLLLDEPTNHLDLPAIEWLEAELAARRSAMILISHDRRFLTTLSRSTTWLDRGRTRSIDRGFGEFESWRDDMLAEEERDQHKLDRKIVDEAHWLRYGVTARRKRNVRRVAQLEELRRTRREHRRTAGKAVINAAKAERSGTLVVEADTIAKSYASRPIVRDFSIRIQRGDRIGIVGPNGSGKTTLVNLLSGVSAPDSGTLKLGANIEMATLDQSRESLDPDVTLREALTAGGSDTLMIGGQPKHVMGYMQDFLFTPEQARTPLRVLSGGERARVMLARALAIPSNLMVLDEPTNDLDIETLDVLQETIQNYAGPVILISHDRDFLDRVVDAVIVPEGNGKWLEYAGGYSDMLTQRGADIRQTKPEASTSRESKPAAPREIAAARRRLSFHEQHALKTLPDRMTELGARVKLLEAAMEDPALYARDPDAFAAATQSLAAVQTELSAAEEQWLELEILRQEIEG